MFFGLSLNRNTIRGVSQLVNVAIAVAILADWMSNEEAHASEHGSDIAVHLLSALALREQAGLLWDGASLLTNSMRLGSIFTAETWPATSFSTIVNLVDSIVHFTNIGVSLLSQDLPSEKAAGPSKSI